jgi:hypothetical protein
VARFVCAAAALTMLSACGPPSVLAAPPADACASPSGGIVDALVLGAGNPADLSGGMSPLAPLHDGDGMQIIHGGQGATMLGFVYSVSGASMPSCLGQMLSVTDTSGTAVVASSAALTTYGETDGTRQTRPVWLPGSYPNDFVVSASAGGQSLTLHLHLLLAE